MKKRQYTQKLIREIAKKNFGYLTDCMFGYSDSGYQFTDDASEYEQNFEEDLQEVSIVVTTRKIKEISEEFTRLKNELEQHIRKKYYK